MRHLFVLSFILLAFDFWAQSIDTEFGKNRVQFNNDFKYWSKYETDNFIGYWYGEGKNIGQTALQLAELDHDDIRKLIEHKINDKIEIVIYTDISDYKQSNIGTEDAFESKSGETQIVGTRMLVYFNGDHQDLRRQIKEGIASVYLSSLKFGANFQEFLQNAVLLDLPEWFEKGLISYAGEHWNVNYDDELRDLFLRKKKLKDFKKFSEKYPRIIGHSFWNYVAINYGKSNISDLLYLTRISRDIESSFQYVFNKNMKVIFDEWYDYYSRKYESEFILNNGLAQSEIFLKKKKWIPASAFSLKPNGEALVYATNDLGKIQIRYFDEKTKKDQLIFKKGFKNKSQSTEYNYPHIAWHPNHNEIAFTIRDRDKINLIHHNFNTNEQLTQVLPDALRDIQSISFVDDRYFIFSAMIDGYSDLVIYDSKYREYRSITEDYYDDVDVKYTTYQDEVGILFASNRTFEHILPEKAEKNIPISPFDIYFYPLKIENGEMPDFKKLPKILSRITNTISYSERYPQILANQKVGFLSDYSGIKNFYQIDENSGTFEALTDAHRNIIRLDYCLVDNNLVYIMYLDGEYQVFKEEINTVRFPQSTMFNSNPESESKPIVKPTEPTFKEGTKFQSKYDDPENLKPIGFKDEVSHYYGDNRSIQENSVEFDASKVVKINSIGITAAGVKFRLENVATRMDNEVLFEGLELIDPQNRRSNPLPMGILAKASLSDIFDDYKLEGGVRVPTSFNGTEYFLVYDNNKKLLDKRIAIYRRSISETENAQFFNAQKRKNESLLGLYRVKYPFNVYSSIRATASVRSDRSYYKVSDNASLNAPIINEKRVGLKLEYVYDNSFEYDLNILHGTRFKIYTEAINQFNLEIVDGFNIDLSKGFTGVLGFDARHYIQILDHSIIALRGAGGTSYGNKPNLYLLGGVAHSLLNGFDDTTPFSDQGQYAFQTNINQMRGFASNIRNGSNYLVSNMEIRLPIMKYFLGKDRGAAFFRHFQIVGFFDAGLAWYGWSPYSSKNPLNTVTLDGKVVQLEVQYFRDPLVLGYGAGIRTKLLGYFVKLDYARGVETRKVQGAKIHISFGTDF